MSNPDTDERFTRIDYSTLNCEWTPEDPAAFTDRITAIMPLAKVAGQLYEYVCHEGNYVMVSVLLRGERMKELREGGGTKS